MSLGSVHARGYRQAILLLGDSITQEAWGLETGVRGWAAALTNSYTRKADVIVRGFSGYTSRWARHIAADVFGDTQYLLTVIFFGANDSVDPALNMRQHVPLEEYEDNLVQLALHASRLSACVCLVTPPGVDTRLWPDRSLERAAMYAAAGRRAVDRVNEMLRAEGRHGSTPGACVCVCVDVNAATTGAIGSVDEGVQAADEPWSVFLRDGLHLSQRGHDAVHACLLSSVSAAAPWASPDSLPLDFPPHRWVLGHDSRAAFTPEALEMLRAEPRGVLAPPPALE